GATVKTEDPPCDEEKHNIQARQSGSRAESPPQKSRPLSNRPPKPESLGTARFAGRQAERPIIREPRTIAGFVVLDGVGATG
ncbi:MAG: hypothetical protein WBV18_07145, partial [Methyloceanibacter sp.]|uniref:hypothetical protein n=1 Tax=Methyloceanibacter sp. TaxID=1965321 RepID=UPI003C3B16DB